MLILSKDQSEINLLQPFFDSLKYSKGQIRIMYYGDSQIEGDRITSYLREKLRMGVGGTGPGMFLPLMPVMYTKSVWIRSSANWEKFNYLAYSEGDISNRNFGPFMAYCRYLPEGGKSKVSVKAYVHIKPSYLADSASAYLIFLEYFTGMTEGAVAVSVSADGTMVLSDTLIRGEGFNETRCHLGGAKDVIIEFEGKVSPDIYGFSIESDKGLVIDNIPQRGSAGLEFTMVDKANLTEAYKKLAPDLFILQYGLNVVKNVSEDFTYYRKGLERQLLRLKEVSPLTPILVISVTDMAENEGDEIRSYQDIPDIIRAQEEAAKDAGVAFWDSYRAMGGKSSIIKWAEKSPP